ncbi:hypothetical protein LRS11_05115 [Pseudomonas sp. J452]|uniref:PA0061/PA0062 family lipoprotein n=1 Tax=Pseudomonas sp. J452 TaxID=2898441 RepID=UPI0021AD6C98|nr:hypothetical protein [Pseudomonas sp. J452]UUY09420.1 hypothetical protein LRS11_05115 [Pseudomonas sp. J452]
MRPLFFLILLTLGACASPLPTPDPQQAWVSLYARAGYTLMAHKLDDRQTRDGRYFQVSPGAHALDVRFQFEMAGGSGGGDKYASEPTQITCQLRLQYDGFAAGQQYRIEARPMSYKARAWLYDSQRRVLARSKVLRCSTF